MEEAGVLHTLRSHFLLIPEILTLYVLTFRFSEGLKKAQRRWV
jgi:hypothetical protein